MVEAASRLNLKPKQSLGQNFLVDENILRNIVRKLNLSQDDAVLEIGPGHGALTRHLVGCIRHLVVVEIDSRIVEELRLEFSSAGVDILHEDFLETDLEHWHDRFGRRLRLVGNIPYHLTSPILFKVFGNPALVQDLTVMVQREVAERIVAQPGTKDYGILSVVTQFYGEPTLLFDVSPNSFYPKPKVTSTVVGIRMYVQPPYVPVNRTVFRTVVRTAFGKRRKTLRNSLKYLPYDERTVERIVSGIDFAMNRRPEELTVTDFVSLTRSIEPLLQ
jgi:16S rRNA (adenine1518-N6/adenine1519-N6)-dimethyltransferase